MIRKLRIKFIAIAMLSVFLVLLILIGMINIMNFFSMAREADFTAFLILENGGAFPSNNKRDNERDDRDNQREMRDFSPELPYRSRYFLVKFNASGELFDINLKKIASLDEQAARELATSVYKTGRTRGFTKEYRYVRQNRDGIDTIVFLNCDSELSFFKNSLILSISISLIGMLAVFILILLLSRRIISPISESYEKQKQFITDAGHELKTPITIINADADVLESELNESNEWLDDIRKQTGRLSHLTNDLIYLSKMQEDDTRSLKTVIALSEIVSDAAQSFYAVALSQNKKYAYAVQPDLYLTGDEKAITKLVTILMDNALKYSPVNGIIRLNLKKEGKQILLSVYNMTEKIEKGNADRLFDRFYRADSSRNSETGGFGLGLAVAKAVTEAHKGKIHAYSSDGRSLIVEAVFPAQ